VSFLLLLRKAERRALAPSVSLWLLVWVMSDIVYLVRRVWVGCDASTWGRVF